MKAVPCKYSDAEKKYALCDPGEATHVRLEMPGPFPTRILPIKSQSGPNWSWNGDTEKPTISPSILTKVQLGERWVICHSFIKNGQVEFLNDCTHDLAGKTVDLLDVD